MEWKVAPSAINYIDMLRKVLAFADDTNDSVTTIGAVVSGGSSGYAVGDFLQIADGASSEVFPSVLANCRATLEVTTVSTGVVTAVRLRQQGCYSTIPTDNGTPDEFNTAIITGSGVGVVTIASVIFAGNGWVPDRITQEVATVAVNAGGTGYSVSDVLSVVGGDTRTGYDAPQATNAATVTVSSESGGVITGLTITTRGIYHRNPGLTAIATTGAGNNDATIDLTFQDFTDSTTDRELIITSSGGFHVGIRSYTNGSTVANWEIMGMQQYVAGNDWDAQLVQSVGRYPDNDFGSYVILEDEAFDYWMRITDRAIIIEFNIAPGVYSNMWLGAHDNYGTAAQFPVPLAVLGCSSRHDLNQGSTSSRWAGMNLCIASASADSAGPGQVLTPGGGWVTARNGFGNASNGDIDRITSYSFANIIPGGDFDTIGSAFQTADEFIGDSSVSALRERWAFWCLTEDPAGTGVGGQANTNRFVPMGNEGDPELPVLWEMTIADTTGADPRLLGELGGVRFLDQRIDGGGGFINAEDEIDDGTNYWYVFNNCNLDRHWTYHALQGA